MAQSADEWRTTAAKIRKRARAVLARIPAEDPGVVAGRVRAVHQDRRAHTLARRAERDGRE